MFKIFVPAGFHSQAIVHQNGTPTCKTLQIITHSHQFILETLKIGWWLGWAEYINVLQLRRGFTNSAFIFFRVFCENCLFPWSVSPPTKPNKLKMLIK